METDNDYQNAISLLESLIKPDTTDYSSRTNNYFELTLEILEKLGNPQDSLSFVHIAGSKGKGSTALILENLASQLDFKVGTFISPHLKDYNERIRIGVQMVDRLSFAKAILEVGDAIKRIQNPHRDVSFFEVLFIAGLCIFKQQGVELAIIECGLGGRFDVTNLIDAKIGCITHLELEHTEKLGSKLTQIAWHKAGIIKNDYSLVIGKVDEECLQIIKHELALNNAVSYALDQDFNIVVNVNNIEYRSATLNTYLCEGSTSRHLNSFEHPICSSTGKLQASALAITCMQVWLGKNMQDRNGLLKYYKNIKSISTSLLKTPLTAKCHIIKREPLIIVDSAHTTSSVLMLSNLLQSLNADKRILIVSLVRYKNVGVLKPLIQLFSTVICTCANQQRAYSSNELSVHIANQFNANTVSMVTPTEALQFAMQIIRKDDLLCISGSTYLAGEALKYFNVEL